jgi:hypothetical protein
MKWFYLDISTEVLTLLLKFQEVNTSYLCIAIENDIEKYFRVQFMFNNRNGQPNNCFCVNKIAFIVSE